MLTGLLTESKQARINVGEVMKMLDRGLSYRKIAELTGHKPASLHRAVKREKGRKVVTTVTDSVFKKDRSEILGTNQKDLLVLLGKLTATAQAQELGGLKLAELTNGIKGVATSVGILFDKERLEDNKSTANVAGITAIVQAVQGTPAERF